MFGQVFLGEDLLPWLVLALGAAMALGTAAALLRPPVAEGRQESVKSRSRDRPSLGPSVVLIVSGTVAAAWALAPLLSG